MNKKYTWMVILIALSVIFMILGGTLAYFRWRSSNEQKTLVTFTIGNNFSCSADGGGDINNNNGNLAPAKCTNTNYAIQRVVKANVTNDTDGSIYLNMWLNVNSIDSGLTSSDNFRYALTTNPNSCTSNLVSSGNFKGTTTGSKVYLMEDKDYAVSENSTYYLYIWLDEVEESPDTQNQNFSLSLGGMCTDLNPRKDAIYVNFGNNSAYFKNATYKNNITSISVVNEINVPNGAINWSIGVSPSNTNDAVAWLETDGNNNNTFALKIGADNKMYVFGTAAYAFSNMSNVSSINLDGLNTSLANNMSSMFDNTGINPLDIDVFLGNQFNTSNVTDMSKMFYKVGTNTRNLNIDLGNNFNTINVTNMSTMFYSMGYKNSFRRAVDFNLNLGNQFNTFKVTNMSGMFRDLGITERFNLGSDFDTSNVTDMYGMFYNVRVNNEIFSLGSKFNTSNVTNMYGMFSGTTGGKNATVCPNFTLDLGDNFNTSLVNNMSNMFARFAVQIPNVHLNLGNNFDTSNVTDMSAMFDGFGSNSKYIDFNLGNKFNTSNVKDMSWMFNMFAEGLNTDFSLDLGNHFDTSNVTTMFSMFTCTGQYATNFNLNLGNKFDTSTVVDMRYMFEKSGEKSINFNLNLGNKFNTSNVKNMSYMFFNTGKNATNFNINLGNKIDISNVNNTESMFHYMGQNSQKNFILDLSTSNFDQITIYTNMFNGFPVSKATIYVKDSAAQSWITGKNSDWGTNFSAANVLIK